MHVAKWLRSEHVKRSCTYVATYIANGYFLFVWGGEEIRGELAIEPPFLLTTGKHVLLSLSIFFAFIKQCFEF